MDLGLHGARVIVTGGAANIGRAIVHAFAREQSRVVIADLDGTQAQVVRKEAMDLGADDVVVCEGDLTAPGAAERAVDAAVRAWGGLDVLVNNAGWSAGDFLARDDDRDRWQRLTDVNILAVVAISRAAVAAMRADQTDGGAIVFVSSEAAFGQIRQGVYGATKAAQVALARTVAREHGRHGIRSNIVCPGLVLPDSPDAVGETSVWAAGEDAIFDRKQVDYMLAGTPLQRLTTAEDVANTVVWLSSDRAARQVTGQLIAVSGGYTMP
ncbi:SDR family oxidoreductase [Streptomyces sp. NPDC046909]|uniref:SDR family NAD(P)-dependent oxidoreductase n=1 Tax=Streptomyces sp. NPDC046909 TaxID=3155617 RepID=UPI0033C23518